MITPTLAFLNGEVASIILVVVIVLGLAGRATSPAPLVLKSWYASDKPLPDGSFIKITGRRSGLVGFIFALLGIDPVTTLSVTNKRIEFHSASLTGTFHRITPLGSVSSSYFGFFKPLFGALAVGIFVGGVLAMIMGAVMGYDRGGSAGMLGVLIGFGVGTLVAFIYYKFNVTQTVGFVELSGDNYFIRFKPSVIEGVSVDEAKAKYAAELIQHFIQTRVDR
ncbi:MAG: hypothetical protein RL250_1394 [Verrucomicrobiota bacterium]